MYSIRDRLSYSIIAGMIVVLAAAAVFLHLRIAGEVQAVFDNALLDKARAMISLTELDDEGVEFDFAEEDVMPEFDGETDPQYYQLWDHRLQPLLKSPSLAAGMLPRQGIAQGRHRFADLDLPDGRAGRSIEIVFLPHVEGDKWQPDQPEDDGEWSELPDARPLTLVIARERESLDSALFAVAASISGVIVVVLLLIAVLVRRLVDHGLRPLSNLAGQVGDIDESRLDMRLGHDGEQSAEIAPIENQLNHLLERLQSAFEREKRFSANVAHELRTPLSELRTLAEVGIMVPDDKTRVTAFFDDVGEISAQMEKVVITLLELTRSEAGLLHSDPEDIELSRFCDEIWQHAVNGAGRERSLRKRVPDDLVVNTDRDKLGMILGNLFNNAVSYSPTEAEVVVEATVGEHGVTLEVRNAAQDLRAEDILHMKDRFWRKHKADHGTGHSGLGLTLVDALARIMQLDVRLQLDQQQVFLVSISGLRLSAQP